MKRLTDQARLLDRALRDTLLPLCAAAVVATVAFSAGPPATSAPLPDGFHEDPRDYAAFSFFVWRAAASSTEALP
jgi:hypothetical protein